MIERARPDAHQHIAGCELRVRRVLDAEHFRSAVLMEANGFHRFDVGRVLIVRPAPSARAGSTGPGLRTSEGFRGEDDGHTHIELCEIAADRVEVTDDQRGQTRWIEV